MTLVVGAHIHPVVAEGAQPSAPTQPRNTFEVSLRLGFFLGKDELERVAREMRKASIAIRHELIIPARRITPDTKDLLPHEKEAIINEVNAENAARLSNIRDFFAKFLSPETATLLATKVRGQVTGFVVRHCDTDERYTLIVEHDLLIKQAS